MAFYEVGKTKLKPVEGTTFGTAGLRERTDLQRLLRDHVEAVSPDTLVIAEEFGEWTESRRKVDRTPFIDYICCNYNGLG